MRRASFVAVAMALSFAAVACSLAFTGDELQDGKSCGNGLKGCKSQGKCIPIDEPCAADCSEGTKDCDGLGSNGCETDIRQSPDHCGACGAKCSAANGAPACAAGTCSISCTAGFGNCNDEAAAKDGCEANFASDSLNCGKCGNACPNGHPCGGGKCLDVSSLAAAGSADHTCAIISDGSVRCWGSNQFGQLGSGEACVSECQKATAVSVKGMTDVVSLAVGKQHTCAAKANGEVWCWGQNAGGQLGLGQVDSVPRLLPEKIPTLSDVTAVTAGEAHTCALKKDGVLLCWGENNFGQSGIGSSAPRVVTPSPVTGAGTAGIKAVAAGSRFTCAIKAEGTEQNIYCWGTDEQGQLGAGGGTHLACPGATDNLSCIYAPAKVNTINDAQAISSGGGHTCAIRQDKSVWCWGNNSAGQVSIDPATSKVLVPTKVAAAAPFGSIALTALGSQHSCAVQSSPAILWCWGLNVKGQLFEDSTIQRRNAPGAVQKVTDAVGIALGSNHTCALTKAGDVKCVGTNDVAQLGNGKGGDQAVHPDPGTDRTVSGLP